jgi:phosphate transport system substrate-binding protein
MRINLLFVFFPLLLITTFSSCARNEPEKRATDHGPIILRGSESELPLINHYSTLWLKTHPGDTLDFDGGGTAVGFEALLRGQTHIANASRMMNDREKKQLSDAGKNVLQLVIARDALAIITGPGISLDSLSMTNVGDLLSGRIRNWKELGGPDLPVRLIGRNNTSGTYQFLLDLFHIDQFAPRHSALTDNAEILNVVRHTPGSIGYVNLGSIVDPEGRPYKYVWVMSLYVDGDRAWSPFNKEAVLNGDYPLSRPLYQYVSLPCNERVKAFLRFELDASVQAGLQDHGFFPVTPIDQQMNKAASEKL